MKMIPLYGCGACGHFWESFDIDQESPKCPECGNGGPPIGTRRSAEIVIKMGKIVDNAIMTAKYTAEVLDREIQNRINAKIIRQNRINAKIIREIEHGSDT